MKSKTVQFHKESMPKKKSTKKPGPETYNLSKTDESPKNKQEGKTSGSNRFHVLSFEQIERLHDVLQSRIPIAPNPLDDFPYSWPQMTDFSRHRNVNIAHHGIYDAYPTVHVRVRDIIRVVRDALLEQDVLVKEVRVNGGAAGFIIDLDSMQNYSDIDLIFSVDLSDTINYSTIKNTVLDVMSNLLCSNAQAGYASYPRANTSGEEENELCAITLSPEPYMMKQYIRKMVRVNKPSVLESDSWSLIALGYQTPFGAKTVDLKFVDKMRRPFEFTVDSFQIVTDALFQFYEQNCPLEQNLYPAVVAESVSGSFNEALSHLKNKIIATHNPEEIRGGGLLKYCKLLVEGYQPITDSDILSLERFMCSRFFIDYPTVTLQYNKLIAYLADHFSNDDDVKVCYLKILYEVVAHSTVCLMTHDRQQTLQSISCLMQQVLCFATPSVASLLASTDFIEMVECEEDVQIISEDPNGLETSSTTILHIPELSKDYWIVDKIFYGRDQFPVNPRQFVVSGTFIASQIPGLNRNPRNKNKLNRYNKWQSKQYREDPNLSNYYPNGVKILKRKVPSVSCSTLTVNLQEVPIKELIVNQEQNIDKLSCNSSQSGKEGSITESPKKRQNRSKNKVS